MSSDFAASCARADVVARRCVGAVVDRLDVSGAAGSGVVDLHLAQVADAGGVVFRFESVRVLSVSDLALVGEAFVDEMSVMHLPKTGAWPPGTGSIIDLHDEMGEQAWVRLHGPLVLALVCGAITVDAA
ncbi:hypothetical protein [Stackebrandtia albiflava]|nr:hypothetical protein [Stackebrandtia albiflava]